MNFVAFKMNWYHTKDSRPPFWYPFPPGASPGWHSSPATPFYAAEGSAAICSTAICSGHVWLKTVSCGAFFFCYISLGRKCLRKNRTKRKLKCRVESEIRLDVGLCSGIWGDHLVGEVVYQIKRNESTNERTTSSNVFLPCHPVLIDATILTCSDAPYKGTSLLKIQFKTQINYTTETSL